MMIIKITIQKMTLKLLKSIGNFVKIKKNQSFYRVWHLTCSVKNVRIITNPPVNSQKNAVFLYCFSSIWIDLFFGRFMNFQG